MPKDNEVIDLRVVLKGKQAERFRKIWEAFGVTNKSEVVRLLIQKYRFPRKVQEA